MQRVVVTIVLAVLASADPRGRGGVAGQSSADCALVTLFFDDFAKLPAGWLSRPVMQFNAAIQEYHWLDRGPSVLPWANAIGHLDSWIAGDEDGTPYVEQHAINDLAAQMTPTFVVGEPEWRDYVVEAKVRPLSFADMVGLVFDFQTTRDHAIFALHGGTEGQLRLRLPVDKAFRTADWKELGRGPVSYDTRTYLNIRIDTRGGRTRAFVNDALIVEAGGARGGKVGIAANMPARFQQFSVRTCGEDRLAIAKRVAARDAELKRLQSDQPRPRLWKQFKTPKFGAGRNVRFGDLDGDGAIDMLIAQNIPRVRGDAFDHISALTAVTLDGRVLWQVGRPNPENALLTNDTPFQVQDLDGDGRADVVLIRDFRLQVLDGRTGAVKRAVAMPDMPRELKPPDRPYEVVSGDSLVFADFAGRGARRDVVIKDRYRTFWVFDDQLRFRWQGSTPTGHFPFPFDFDGDGREELLVGYSVWSHEGRLLWTREKDIQDHADAIGAGHFADGPGEPRVYWTASDEGLVVLDRAGTVLKHQRVGHTQTLTVGNYRPERPGLEMMTINFWRSPGVVNLFDPDGNVLATAQPVFVGSPLLPVNWRGDGQEFALLSADVREGGMLDGQLRRAVMFPDDGHPELAAAVLNVTGDPRDEVILWDQERVWIYTQDRPFVGRRIYAPIRNPPYNDSNYRANISLPRWIDTR